MEVKIREKDVLLTTHKSYCEVDETKGLLAVSQYGPFLKYIEECEKRGPVPHALIVRNIFRSAHRVVGVVAEIEYVDQTGHKLSQTVNLTDRPPAVLLPVISIEKETGVERFVLLVHQRQISTGMAAVTEAISGIVGLNGEFCSIHNNDLVKAGLDLDTIKAYPQTYTMGNGGDLPCTFFSVVYQCKDTAEIEKYKVQGDGLKPQLVAVPLQDVLSCGDLKAAMAQSILANVV